MKCLLLITLLMTSACAKPGSKQPSVVDMTPAEVKFSYDVYPAAGTPVGRFYFFPGYTMHISDLKSAPFTTMTDYLHNAGYEIVYVQWPTFLTAGNVSSDKGLGYLNAFKNYISDLNTSLAPVPKTITGGFSFGGLHAIIASSVVGADITIAHLSVTKVSLLAEFNGIDTSELDVTAQTIPADLFISCGTSDYRVDWRETAQLFSTNPGFHEYPGLDHRTRLSEVDDIVTWLGTVGI